MLDIPYNASSSELDQFVRNYLGLASTTKSARNVPPLVAVDTTLRGVIINFFYQTNIASQSCVHGNPWDKIKRNSKFFVNRCFAATKKA